MSESSAHQSAAGPWLISPVIDVLVGCGLLAIPLGALAAWASIDHASTVVVVAGALTVFVNAPHYAATIVRALHHDARARRVLAVATAVALLLVVGAHLRPIILAWLFSAYLTWSPWHYATQNHGVSLLLLARGGGAPGAEATRTERRLLKGAHAAAAVAAIVSIHTGLSEPFLRRVGFSPDFALVAAAVGLAAAVLVGGGVLVRLKRRGASTSSVMASGLLLLTSVVWFAVPGLLQVGNSLVYVGGAAALLHCAQYLWITYFVEGRVAFVQGRRFDGLAWAATLVALGVGLFTLGPWVVSLAAGYDLIVSLLIVQAVVNLHHFTVDAFVWKLRDPALAAPLFAGRELAPARRGDVSNTKATIATVVVVGLLVVGAVDVAQLAGTRGDASDTWRSRAMAFNGNDSRIWVQEAQTAVAANDADGARSDLGRAVQLSPYNVDAQRALLRLHAITGHLEEAWARRDAAPAGVLNDVSSLVTFADVALRTGRTADAESLAREALALTSAEPHGTHAIEARRILGTALLDQGNLGDARPLLKEALDDAEATFTGDAIRQGALLDLAVALARTHVALGQWDPAMLLFDRALEGAALANRADIAADALIGQATVYMRRDDAREALTHLQRGLQVAQEAAKDVDAERTARAWLDYGGLLAASEGPMRLRFACALKARQFAERMRPGKRQDDLMHFIHEATGFVEAVLTPTDIESVRTDVDSAAADALALGYAPNDGTDDGGDDDNGDDDAPDDGQPINPPTNPAEE